MAEPPNVWFDINISNKLNLMDINNSVQKNNCINFGEAIHNKKHTHSFQFLNNCDNNFVFIPKKNEDINIIKQQFLKTLEKSINTIKLKQITQKEQITKIKSVTTKINKKIDNISKIISVKKYCIKPTNEQINLLNEWFRECTKVYNCCVDKYKTNKKLFSQNYMNIKKVIFDEIYGESKKSCPYDILTDEIKTFCANLKSANTNLTNGNIKTFELSYKNTKKTQCIFIPSTAVTNKTFYTSHLGKTINGLEQLIGKNVTNDCRLFFDKLYRRYIFLVPEYIDKKEILDRGKIVALDPGEKIFMTYHGLNSCGYIGNDVREKILLYESKIRRWQRIIGTKHKKGNGVNKEKKKVKKQNLRKINMKINKNYRKIQNYVKELHNKTALFLCKTYDKILIPEFKTQNMVRNNVAKNKITEIFNKEGKMEGKKELKKYERKKRLNKRVKFVLNSLSHYNFRQHLINKCNEYGCEIKIVTEEFTSMTCTKCGELSKKYENRIKECEKCKYKINRDINGARNILIKNLKAELELELI